MSVQVVVVPLPYGKYKEVIYGSEFFASSFDRVVDKVEIDGEEQKLNKIAFLNAVAVVTVCENDTLVCKINRSEVGVYEVCD